MNVVHQLCTVKNRTIIAVIHQPAGEVFELFNSLTLLADGYPIYVGPAKGAISFYETAGFPLPELRSAPDHLLHTVNADFDTSARDNINKLADAYATSPTAAELVAGVDESHAAAMIKYVVDTKAPSGWKQTLVLTERAMLNNQRDPIIFWLRCVMFIMLCMCVGFIYFQLDNSWKDVFSRTALLFFTTAFLTFMSISGFPAFMEDMKVFIRERLNGYYSVGSFVAANTISSIPFLVIISVTSTLPVYWLSNLNAEAGRFFYFIFNLFSACPTTRACLPCRRNPLAHGLTCAPLARSGAVCHGVHDDGTGSPGAALSGGHRRRRGHPRPRHACVRLLSTRGPAAAPRVLVPAAFPVLRDVRLLRLRDQRVRRHHRMGLPVLGHGRRLPSRVGRIGVRVDGDGRPRVLGRAKVEQMVRGMRSLRARVEPTADALVACVAGTWRSWCRERSSSSSVCASTSPASTKKTSRADVAASSGDGGGRCGQKDTAYPGVV